jgi:hypothetical protein
MFDRNWAHWTTFTQVYHPVFRVGHYEILSAGRLLVPLRRAGLLRPSTEANPYTICGLLLRPNTLAPPLIKCPSTAKLPLHDLRRVVRAPRDRSPYNGCRVGSSNLFQLSDLFSSKILYRNGLNSASIRHEVNDELISSIEYTSVIYTRYLPG